MKRAGHSKPWPSLPQLQHEPNPVSGDRVVNIWLRCFGAPRRSADAGSGGAVVPRTVALGFVRLAAAHGVIAR
jgi:hypothetical protein